MLAVSLALAWHRGDAPQAERRGSVGRATGRNVTTVSHQRCGPKGVANPGQLGSIGQEGKYSVQRERTGR